jgi:ABC-type polysaccharide/polyol phosphate export permease
MGRMRAHLLSAPGIGASDLYALGIGLLVLLAGWFVFTRLSPHFEDFL